MVVDIGSETWQFDTIEEFLADCPDAAGFHFHERHEGVELTVDVNDRRSRVSVAFPCKATTTSPGDRQLEIPVLG